MSEQSSSPDDARDHIRVCVADRIKSLHTPSRCLITLLRPAPPPSFAPTIPHNLDTGRGAGVRAGDQLVTRCCLFITVTLITSYPPRLRSSSLTHSNCDMGMSHQWPSKAHLQQGDVAFCNVNILIIITRTGGKNHLCPPLFLIKIMSTSLIQQYCLATQHQHSLHMQICSVDTHVSHSLLGFYRVIKSHQRSC